MKKEDPASPATAGPGPDTGPESTSFRTCLPALLILTTIFFFNFLSRIVMGPLLPDIEPDLGIDHSRSGGLFFFISAGYFLGLMGSGFISSRISHRWTIIWSCLVLGGTLLLISASTALSVMSAALFLLGMATGIYLPSGVATISNCVDSRQWGKAFSVHEIAPSLAFVVAPLFAITMLQWFSWRGSMGILGAAALGAGCLFYLKFKSGDSYGESPHPEAIKALIIQPAFWIMVFLGALAISSTVGVYTMLPLYLVTERGMGQSDANTLVSLSRIPAIATVLLAGPVIDRIGPRRTMSLVFIFTGLMTVTLGMASVSWISLAVCLQPLFAACFFPANFAMLSAIAPQQSRNIAVSLAVPIGFVVGGGVVPGVIGMLADAGMFSLAFIIVGAAIFTGSFVALLLDRLKH
jgi:NNP family nitrate/nitrite transporter-like MFS transporter